MAKTKACTACNRSMIFAEGSNRPIPLDARAQAVYTLTETPGDESNPVAVKLELYDEAERLAEVEQILRAEGDPFATIAMIEQVLARPQGKAKKLYISHFANCPNASDFSRGAAR